MLACPHPPPTPPTLETIKATAGVEGGAAEPTGVWKCKADDSFFFWGGGTAVEFVAKAGRV